MLAEYIREYTRQRDIKRGFPELISGLSSKIGFVRLRARRSLVAAGHSAVALLIDVLGSANEQARWEAAKALSEIGDPSAATALVGALEDEDRDVRWMAAE